MIPPNLKTKDSFSNNDSSGNKKRHYENEFTFLNFVESFPLHLQNCQIKVNELPWSEILLELNFALGIFHIIVVQ